MTVRRFTEDDAKEVSLLIISTLKISNSKDYSTEVISELINRHRPKDIIKKAERTHFYVAEDFGKIVACGAIGLNEQAENKSLISSIFVLPKKQGQGVGRLIMETLEKDEYFINSTKAELYASITALNFYLKLGYTFKNGITKQNKDGLYILEKHR